jgi:heme oxygenase
MLVALLQPQLSQAHYVRVLQVFLTFYTGLQPALTAALHRAGYHYALADRIDWLRRDLADLAAQHPPTGPTHPTPTTLPTDTVWHLATAASIAGTLYVIEGSTLGGQVIARRVQAALGVDAARGARFFNGWGEVTGQKWQDYWQFATSICGPADEAMTASAAVAAVATFNAIERALDAAWQQTESE